jgi:hypothetical protein
MQEDQQRRLEIIRTCLNQLEKYFVGSAATSLITDAQLQLDKLLSTTTGSPAGEPVVGVLPISPNEAAKAFTERCKEFPPNLILWFNKEIVKNYNVTNDSATIYASNAPNQTQNAPWLTLSALYTVFRAKGWNVRAHEELAFTFVFSKRDEKQAPSIN